MEFKDIKAGNYVLSKETIWHDGKTYSFWVPIEVHRITKTLIVLANGFKYYKQTGVLRGDSTVIIKPFTENENQTDEMKAFKLKLDKVHLIMKAREVMVLIDYDTENLDKILTLTKEIIKMMYGNKKHK